MEQRLELANAGQLLTAGKGEDGAEMTTGEVLEEIAAERRRQRDEGGYDDRHDDCMLPSMWVFLVHDRLERGFARSGGVKAAYRRRLIKAAALCVAAVEAYDRRQEETTKEARGD